MSGRVLENKLVAVTTDENYQCYNWIIEFSCTCDDCFRDSYSSIDSPYFRETTILPDYSMWSLRIGIRDKKNTICYSTEYLNLENKLQLVPPYSIRNCNYWPGGVLKIVVEIIKPVNVTLTHAEKVLKNLQQSDKFSDVTLVVGEHEFPAHKAILAAQSSVFLAMFEHDMKEKIESKVIIEDISDEVMQLVLNYMYTGSADKERLKDLAIDVLVAADKYALEDLVKICEEVLVRGLNNDNVFKVLQTANFYKLESLKKAAVTFIAHGIKDLVETDEFVNLANSSMDLVKEIMLTL